MIILSTRILFLYFQNIPKLSRRKIAWKYLTNAQKLPTETKYNSNHFRIFLLKKFFTLHCSRSDMQINGSCKSSWHDFTQKLKNPTKVQLLEVVVLLLEHLFIYEAYPKMRDRNLSLCNVNTLANKQWIHRSEKNLCNENSSPDFCYFLDFSQFLVKKVLIFWKNICFLYFL